MSGLAKPYLTPEQYLEIERKAETKSEYLRGEMFAMAGASFKHSALTSNLTAILGQQLRGRACVVCTADLRINVSEEGVYTYPDLSVVCGEPELLDAERDTLLNPVLIAEVLSASTEAYDRGMKFQRYRSIPSLRHYLLVAEDRMQVDLFTREGEQWMLRSANQPEQRLQFEVIGCEILMSDLYDKVNFG